MLAEFCSTSFELLLLTPPLVPCTVSAAAVVPYCSSSSLVLCAPWLQPAAMHSSGLVVHICIYWACLMIIRTGQVSWCEYVHWQGMWWVANPPGQFWRHVQASCHWQIAPPSSASLCASSNLQPGEFVVVRPLLRSLTSNFGEPPAQLHALLYFVCLVVSLVLSVCPSAWCISSLSSALVCVDPAGSACGNHCAVFCEYSVC